MRVPGTANYCTVYLVVKCWLTSHKKNGFLEEKYIYCKRLGKLHVTWGGGR